MDSTTKWIIGSIGVIILIVGLLSMISGAIFMIRKRNIRIIKENREIMRHQVIKSLRNNELDLLHLYSGSSHKYISDDRLHVGVKKPDTPLFKMNTEIKLLERKVQLENKLYILEYPKPLRYKNSEFQWEYVKNRIRRAQKISYLESKISKLRDDVDSFHSSTEKKDGSLLVTLGKDKVSIVSKEPVPKKPIVSREDITNQFNQDETEIIV